MNMNTESTRLYFDKNLICIGSYDEVTGKDYYASESFALPNSYNPVGKTESEIKDAISSARKQAFLNNCKQPSSLDLYREFNYYECLGLR